MLGHSIGNCLGLRLGYWLECGLGLFRDIVREPANISNPNGGRDESFYA